MSVHHLGKRPARPYTSDHTPIRELVKALPKGTIPRIPEHFGHGYAFGRTGWWMMGNGPCDDGTIPSGTYAHDGAGDCAWAAFSHIFMESAKDARGTIPRFTCASTLGNYANYLGLGGYGNLNAQNDQGTDLQEALRRVQTIGYTDANGTVHRIGPTVTGEPGNMEQAWAITYLFEADYIGVNLQEAQDQAFPGKWDYDPSSSSVGGHCVALMGDNGLITWGDRVAFTVAFFENLCDEHYGFIDPLRYNTVTGKTMEGFTDVDLEEYVTLVAQMKAGA